MIWAHNLCHLSLSATRVTVQWLTNQSFLVVIVEVTMCSYYTWAKFYHVCIYHCQMIGCFNHQVHGYPVCRRQWLWENYFGIRVQLHKQPDPKSYLTTDNPQNICEWVTTTVYILKMLLWWLSHRCSVVTISFYVVAYFRYTKDYVTLTIHTQLGAKEPCTRSWSSTTNYIYDRHSYKLSWCIDAHYSGSRERQHILSLNHKHCRVIWAKSYLENTLTSSPTKLVVV